MPTPHRPTRLPRRARAALVAAALGLTTGGCFGGAAGTADEGRLRLALAFPPVTQMSPYSDDAALLGRVGAAETLVALDDDGTPRPRLAAEWERTDPTTWRFTLREDVTFHDGTPLTAEHAAAALDHAADARPLPRSLAGTDLDAEADGAHTLVVDTGHPDPILPQRLSSPELVVLAPDAYADDPASPDPVGAGTGPFELTEVNGASSATLEAFPDYWGGAPKADGLDVRFVEDAASRVGALRSGEVDIVDAVPVAHLGEVTDQRVIEVPLPRTVGVFLNNARGAFRDPGLRAAAATAIDADAITRSVYEGHADRTDGIYGPVSSWAEDRPDPADPPEPAEPDGTFITLATYSDRPELPEAASAVAEQLRGAGFRVDVTVQEFATLEGELMDGAFDAVIGTRSYLLDTSDPIGHLASDWSCDGSFNLARLCDADVDDAIADAAEHADLEKRRAAALAIEADILASRSLVPLAAERARISTAPDIEGVAEDPLERTIVTAETHRS